MNPKAFLLLLLTLPAMFATAQFTWSNPQPSGWLNTKVVFTDTATGYIMNYNGDLITTTDAGAHWYISRNFRNARSLDAKDSILVVGGDTSIFISTNKGQSWGKSIIRKRDGYVEKFQIINKDTIFALCNDPNLGLSELHVSSDGGGHWQMVNGDFRIKGLDFINSKLGYATSFGGVYQTTDGGLTWQQVYKSTGGYSFITVKFLDSKTGFAAQDLGIVIKTTDGGTTWTTCRSSTYGNVLCITFASPTTGFLTGDDGTLYRSKDGGNTWEFRGNHLGDRYGIYSACFTSATTGYFVGLRGQIFKTTDGGDSYQDYSPTYTDIKPISFPTPLVGYAGAWEKLFKTTDGGKQWSQLPFSLDNSLYRRFQYLHFFTNDSGLALAQSPVVLYHTQDGGEHWQTVSLPLPTNYMDNIRGFFVVRNIVYLSVDGIFGHTVFQSTDRGETWHTQSQSSNSGRNNLFFIDEKTGYCTAGPNLYKTTDSAKTWTELTTYNNYGYAFNKIWFTDAATGYVVGNGGFNIATKDSGKTWTRFAITPDNFNFNDVYAIRFFDKNVGYLTSGYGGIYKTTNAGKTWTPEKPVQWDCRTIEMTTDTSLFIGGEYGIILKKDMREFSIDSLAATLDTSCSIRISANVTAVLSQVDSIWVEYGIGGFSKTVLATPSSVKDSTIKCAITLQDLKNDSSYQIRGKILYRNTYYYSEPITFRPTNGLPKPTVTFNGTLLMSSAMSGNQWYLNGVPITGATNTTYQPTTQGIYTVQQKLNGCTSAMSEGFNYTTTAINDPVLSAAITIFPNPATTTMWIQNRQSRKLHFRLMDMWGRTLREGQTAVPLYGIDVQSVGAGIYTLKVEEQATRKQTSAKLVKL